MNGNYNYLGFSNYSLAARVIELPYEDIVTDLGFDPVEMTQMLPEKFHMTEECLEEGPRGHQPALSNAPGRVWLLPQGGAVGVWEIWENMPLSTVFRMIFKRLTEEEKNGTVIYFPLAIIFSEENAALGGDVFGRPENEPYGAQRLGSMKLASSTGTMATHLPPAGAGISSTRGFYMGDLAVSIESSYDYCTQAEFVEVFLAIFDYVRELEILKHAGDLRGSPAVLPIPLQLCAEFTIYSNDLCNNI